ncbi:leucine-rich repeat domain-containing protein [Carnobacterium maltaromaticum]|uniref:leucine-rich repeat domain-containing protein n=1 Tax=Carnobacterium maltaromaticum TaxID=2751 RepID=UPI00298AB47A|nr:leucine-rich repeat domain-containing protein [Carnobacterium maltaromaticum]MDW5523746.1 leucine-rich repeat domain-containing protein [Carnobacterium maltaromaticum]
MKKLDQYVLLVTLLVANLQPIGVVFAEPSYGLASEGTKGNELTSNIDSSTIQSIEKTIAPTETDSRIVSNETVEITDDSKAEASNTMQEVSTFANEIDAWMPDKNLQNSVATELNKPVANITQEDMKNLPITLIVTGQNISSIQGLEYAINLQKLTISDNKITDLNPISNLTNLRHLDIAKNAMTDISPLRNLTNLVELHVDSNPQISDYTPISNLTNIYYFGARFNDLKDISFLSSLPELELIYLWGNKISDASPLKNLKKVKTLELAVNQLTDISPLASISTLKDLNLSTNTIKDISVLKSLTNLTQLNFNTNKVEDISELKTLTKLTNLTFYNNQVKDISFVNSLPALIAVDASNQSIQLNPIIVADKHYLQSSIVKYSDASLVPIIANVSSDGTGISSNENIEWTNLASSGQFISNWNKSSTATPTIKFSGTITLPYSRVAAGVVTVKYLDTDGNELHNNQFINGFIGDNYDATTDAYKLTISGYTLDTTKLPNNGTGVLTDKQQTVTYIYTKDPVKAEAVLIEYIDATGNELHVNQEITGFIGDRYDATTEDYKLILPGYTLNTKNLPTNGVGILSNQVQKVIYVYTKNTSSIIPPVDQNTSNTPNVPNKVNKEQELPSDSKFPKTGEQKSYMDVILGGLLLVLGSSVYFNRRNKI